MFCWRFGSGVHKKLSALLRYIMGTYIAISVFSKKSCICARKPRDWILLMISRHRCLRTLVTPEEAQARCQPFIELRVNRNARSAWWWPDTVACGRVWLQKKHKRVTNPSLIWGFIVLTTRDKCRCLSRSTKRIVGSCGDVTYDHEHNTTFRRSLRCKPLLTPLCYITCCGLL